MKSPFFRLVLTACACAVLTACMGGGSNGSGTATAAPADNSASSDTSASSGPQSSTGLPSYPNATDQGSLPSMNRNGNSYSEDSLTSSDDLNTVEGWYRQQLSGAIETAANDAYMSGVVFTLPDKDEVDVYNDKTGDASVVTIKLLKYLGAGD